MNRIKLVHSYYLPLAFLLILHLVPVSFFAQAGPEPTVRIWQETITLPTYFTNPAEECPIFFEHKSYQGASRVAYPYPVQDNLSMEKGSKEYTGLFIENEYIKLCVLPEIGGRLMYATDKTNGYELFYRQDVIKPMLIGMLGAWISGGIEFCVFHHHRASTHMPVDYQIEENEDGSATIWIGEFEPRHRMRWNIGISLFPGRSWVRVDGNLINPTEQVNSMLYWANVATHVNEDYQVIFPPSTQYATFHAKNSFAHWPVTEETYNGKDYYQDNIDASWYKNHPESGSFFAHDIDAGVLAGYDWGKQAGTMHVANHHIVKGAKLWQWGVNSTFDREALTDNNGPYAELMTGAYSDNQPDYSWIKPYEVKQFRQTWYPLRETEGMKHGNLEATVNLELREGGRVFLAANTTQKHSGVQVSVRHDGETIFEETIDIGPAQPFKNEFNPTGELVYEQLQLSLHDKAGRELISYQPKPVPYNPELPPTVVPPGRPESYQTNEELYYAGERIRQFHNARLRSEDYFLEALKRDPLDVRCNTAMGIIRQQNGDFEAAKTHFRKAISRITANYTRPRDCEPLFHLGVILKQEGQLKAATDTLYRAAWDYTYRSAAYFQLAEIHIMKKDYPAALKAVDNALMINATNLNALNLRTSLLRLSGELEAAVETARKVLEVDRLNHYAHHELSLLTEAAPHSEWTAKLRHLLRAYPENYLELSSYYLQSGLYNEAVAVLEMARQEPDERLSTYPTIYYYLGYLHHLRGEEDQAKNYFAGGRQQSIKYCFPFRLESIKVFKTALQYEDQDARACYYLGNLLFDKQPFAAMGWWEKAVQLEPELAMAHRNLGFGYAQAMQESEKAVGAYRLAIRHDPTQPRFYLEMDELLEATGATVQQRLNILSEHSSYVEKHQHAVIRKILVLVLSGQYREAIELMDSRTFYRQEGVNIIHDLHVQAHLLRGKALLQSGKAAAALEEFLLADTYPDNQMIERPLRYEMNPRIYYYTARAYEALGNKRSAGNYYAKAADEQRADQEYLFYRAMALTKTGRQEKAKTLFTQMIENGEALLEEEGEVDFFAKFGGDLSEQQRTGMANQWIGLGHLGLGNTEKAKSYLQRSLEADVNQLWSKVYLE